MSEFKHRTKNVISPEFRLGSLELLDMAGQFNHMSFNDWEQRQISRIYQENNLLPKSFLGVLDKLGKVAVSVFLGLCLSAAIKQNKGVEIMSGFGTIGTIVSHIDEKRKRKLVNNSLELLISKWKEEQARNDAKKSK